MASLAPLLQKVSANVCNMAAALWRATLPAPGKKSETDSDDDAQARQEEKEEKEAEESHQSHQAGRRETIWWKRRDELPKIGVTLTPKYSYLWKPPCDEFSIAVARGPAG